MYDLKLWHEWWPDSRLAAVCALGLSARQSALQTSANIWPGSLKTVLSQSDRHNFYDFLWQFAKTFFQRFFSEGPKQIIKIMFFVCSGSPLSEIWIHVWTSSDCKQQLHVSISKPAPTLDDADCFPSLALSSFRMLSCLSCLSRLFRADSDSHKY